MASRDLTHAASGASLPAHAGCDMGVGCDEVGVCFAEAHGEPDRCGRPTFRQVWERKARWNGFGAPRIWLADFNRDDEAESDVTVAYTYSGGSPDTFDASRGGPGGWDPGYPPEVEIYAAFGSTDEVTLTEAEELRFGQWLMENPPEDEQ